MPRLPPTALAYHGKILGIKVTVVMPTNAPLTKIENCEILGAEVILYGAHLGESRERGMQLAKERDLVYIHGFNDPAVVNGAGGCGIEIMDQCADVDAVVVAVGGGGLIAGVATACKLRNPHVQIIGVQAAACPSFAEARKHGFPVVVGTVPSLADGAIVTRVGGHSFRTADPIVDRIVTVEERHICMAIVQVLDTQKIALEGAGALPVAAFLSGQLDDLKTKKVVVILSGGNIDITVLGRVIDRGLYYQKRMLRMTVVVSDNPGSLADFLTLVAKCGDSVKDIMQEREFAQSGAAGPHRNWDPRATVRPRSAGRSHEGQVQLFSRRGRGDNGTRAGPAGSTTINKKLRPRHRICKLETSSFEKRMALGHDLL